MSPKEELQAIVNAWVARFVNHDLDGCVSLYTANGAIYQPYDIEAVGVEALRQAHRHWLESGETNKKLEVMDGYISGDLAYCIARYSGDYPTESGEVQRESGVVVLVYHKAADGQWLCRVSALNSDTPPLAGDG